MQLVLRDRSVDLDTGKVSTGSVLRPMELRLLRYLVRHKETLVSVRELLVDVWGYAPDLRTATIHSTIYRLRSAIEADSKDPRHLVTVAGAGVKLVDVEQAQRSDTNFSPPRDRLIGRERELAAIGERPGRLVTLVGPSGVGKSRLALEWAAASGPAFPRGRWLVEATGVASAADLTDRVARVLRVDANRVLDSFAAGSLLLLLDDLPVDATGLVELLDRWLDADGLSLLVTAHDALHVSGERIVALSPLPLPQGPDDLDAPAVALLVERIRQGCASFRPEEDARHLTELAVAVDGFPLALEIAAAHGAALGPAVTLEALRRRPLGVSGASGRRRSIDAMLECTWDRLPGWARTALGQLGAFRRSFTLEAADAVLALPPGSPSPTEAVAALVVRGLLTPMSDAPGRFRAFDTVRHFVSRQGADPGATERLVARCVRAAAIVLGDGLSEDIAAPDAAEVDEWDHVARWVLRDRDLGNDRAAIPVFAYVAAVAAGRHTLAEALAERLEERALPDPCRGWFLATRALWLMRWQRSAEAQRYAERALAELPERGVPILSTQFAFALAIEQINFGAPHQAQRSYARGTEARMALSLPRRQASMLELCEQRAEFVVRSGEAASLAAARRSVQLADQLGQDPSRLVRNLAVALFDLDRLDEAEVALQRANTLARTVQERCEVLALRARIAYMRDELSEARSLIQFAMAEAREEPTGMLSWLHLSRAHIRCKEGDFDGAEADAAWLTTHPLYQTPRLRQSVAHLRATIAAVRGSPLAMPMLAALVAEAERGQQSKLLWMCAEVLSEIHARDGDWASALAMLDRTDRVPRTPGQVQRRVEVLRGLGRTAEALDVVQQAALAPEPPPWLPHAAAAAACEAGVPTRLSGGPLANHPWTRVYLARVALHHGERERALALVEGLPRAHEILLRLATDGLRAQIGLTGTAASSP